MSERTRLDEIVDEVKERAVLWPGKPYTQDEMLKAVADLCFQHVVEQCAVAHTRYCHDGDTDKVQPAPAGEPKCGWRPHRKDCQKLRSLSCCFTRSHGERRKGCEWHRLGDYLNFFGIKELAGDPQPDRRSGKDRRKP